MLERSHRGSDTDEALAKSIAELKCKCGKDLYGVLWVEWVDGVAYRKGCGYVRKEIWDSHKLEDVDLVLG